VLILRAVSVIDLIIDWRFDRLKGDFFRDAGSDNPSRFLSDSRLIPTRFLSVRPITT
jgi:hypothetical protein